MKKSYAHEKVGFRVRAAAALAAALLASVFAGCALGLPEGGGSVEMSFAPGAKAYGDGTAYVYLYRGNSLFRGPYTAGLTQPDQYTRGTVRIDGIPPGKDYRLVVLREIDYGEGMGYSFASPQDPISVRAGAETVVSVSDFDPINFHMMDFSEGVGGPPPFTDLPVVSVATMSESETKITAVGNGKMYTGIDHESTLMPAYFEMENSNPPPINSVSPEYPFTGDNILANAGTGLYQNQGNGYTRVYPIIPETEDIRKSSAYGSYYIMKTSDALIGGYSGTWATAHLGTGRRIYDMFVYFDGDGEYSAYLATDFAGAFVLPMEFFDLSFDYFEEDPAFYLLNPGVLEDRYDIKISPFSNNEFWGASMPRILCFGWNPTSMNDASTLYIGTEKGLYKAVSIGSSGILETPHLVEGTEGLAITKIAVSQYEGAACLTPSGVILYNPRLDTPADRITRLPFVGLWAGEINDMALFNYDYDGQTWLLVAGRKGLAAVNVSDWMLDGGDF